MGSHIRTKQDRITQQSACSTGSIDNRAAPVLFSPLPPLTMASARGPSLKNAWPAAWLRGCRAPLKGAVDSTTTATCSPPRRSVSSWRCRQNTYLQVHTRAQDRQHSHQHDDDPVMANAAHCTTLGVARGEVIAGASVRRRAVTVVQAECLLTRTGTPARQRCCVTPGRA